MDESAKITLSLPEESLVVIASIESPNYSSNSKRIIKASSRESIRWSVKYSIGIFKLSANSLS